MFIRADGFYSIDIEGTLCNDGKVKTSDQIAFDCVACNPGTLRVENLITGKLIFDAEHAATTE
jgi:hypothetical protein